MKTTLKIQTPAGEFTRATNTAYTHAVVWASPRAANRVAVLRTKDIPLFGVDARWTKDRGYGVTWHASERSAQAAAAKFYKWDRAATLVGVFAVNPE